MPERSPSLADETSLIETNPIEVFEPSKLVQVEQALTILAAIVARLAREVRAGKLKRLEHDRLERRVELLESLNPGSVQAIEILDSIRESLVQLRRRANHV